MFRSVALAAIACLALKISAVAGELSKEQRKALEDILSPKFPNEILVLEIDQYHFTWPRPDPERVKKQVEDHRQILAQAYASYEPDKREAEIARGVEFLRRALIEPSDDTTRFQLILAPGVQALMGKSAKGLEYWEIQQGKRSFEFIIGNKHLRLCANGRGTRGNTLDNVLHSVGTLGVVPSRHKRDWSDATVLENSGSLLRIRSGSSEVLVDAGTPRTTLYSFTDILPAHQQHDYLWNEDFRPWKGSEVPWRVHKWFSSEETSMYSLYIIRSISNPAELPRIPFVNAPFEQVIQVSDDRIPNAHYFAQWELPDDTQVQFWAADRSALDTYNEEFQRDREPRFVRPPK